MRCGLWWWSYTSQKHRQIPILHNALVLAYIDFQFPVTEASSIIPHQHQKKQTAFIQLGLLHPRSVFVSVTLLCWWTGTWTHYHHYTGLIITCTTFIRKRVRQTEPTSFAVICSPCFFGSQPLLHPTYLRYECLHRLIDRNLFLYGLISKVT